MHITAICPTFRRPRLIPNILAMFIAQEYPPDQCRLIIYDDGGIFTPQVGSNWEIIVRPDRAPTLGTKNAELVELAISRGTDAIVLFEDDDCYLPGYLIAHARGLEKAPWTAPNHVLFKYGGDIRIADADRRFHGSWGFKVKTYLASDGYPDENEAFDSKFGTNLRLAAGEPFKLFTVPDAIQYVYRWHAKGYANGSAWGKTIYESTALNYPYEPSPGVIGPQFDDDTLQVYRDFRRKKKYLFENKKPSLTTSGYLRKIAIDASNAKADAIKNNLSEAELEIVNEDGKTKYIFPVEYLDLLLDDDYSGADVLYYEPNVTSANHEAKANGIPEINPNDQICLPENIKFRMVLENITSALLFYKLFIENRNVQGVVDEFLELYRLTKDNGEELIHDIKKFHEKFQYIEYVFPDS